MPAFTAAAAELSVSGAVSFVEIECRANQALCAEHQAGAGGWPTVKHFSSFTGPNGSRFVQRTQSKVCDELATPGVLNAYVAHVLDQAKSAVSGVSGEEL